MSKNCDNNKNIGSDKNPKNKDDKNLENQNDESSESKGKSSKTESSYRERARKALLSYKNVLAVIIKVVFFDVFDGISVEDIANKYILDDQPENPRAELYSEQDQDIGDTTTIQDLYFRVLTPFGWIIRVDLEIQGYSQGENFAPRIVIYTSKPAAHQQYLEKTDYAKFERVASIWITDYSKDEEKFYRTQIWRLGSWIELSREDIDDILAGKSLRPDILEKLPNKQLVKHLDQMMTAAVINTDPDHTESKGFYGLVNTVLEVDLDGIDRTLKSIGLKNGLDLEKGGENMNLVQYMMKKSEERGVKIGEERGVKIGEERGVKIGEQNEKQRNVLSAIKGIREMDPDTTESSLLETLQKLFQLDKSEAEKYLALSLQS